MAALYLQNDEIGFKHTGVTVTVPNNDVARLMYYLQSVCTAVECEQDSDIRRFTNYANWYSLSVNEQEVLLAICYKFSPDVLDDKVFFQNDALCGDSLNDFLEISQVRHQFLVAESIVIAGQTREVNKVMVYRRQWMDKNYWMPMQGLSRTLNLLTRPAITHPVPPRPTHTPTQRLLPSTPILHQPSKKNSCCHCDKACVIGSTCGFIFALACVIAVIVYFLMKK